MFQNVATGRLTNLEGRGLDTPVLFGYQHKDASEIMEHLINYAVWQISKRED